MSNCLICDEIIEENFISLITSSKQVCYKCYNSFKKRDEEFNINGLKGCVLYYYDEFFKNLLYRYKACGDYTLKDAFLLHRIKDIKRKYKGYSMVLAPSNKENEQKRGFNHLEAIFECLNMPIIKCFKKTKKWKLVLDSTLSLNKDIKLGSSVSLTVPAWAVIAIEINI